jgi:asparagine synthase (glutamine-hydrolysing)
MCGIAGIIDFNSSGPPVAVLKRMLGLMRHRGPDAAGIYINGPAGLAHTRLSIIDLDGGGQPIHNENRSIWVVYNGEIFNYPELRGELTAAGHQFYTQTDTEVLVHAYEEYGMDMVNRFNGQFAFALWDKNLQTLFLGRDRVGIRPLFYHFKHGRIVFGSEIKALFADPLVPRKIDVHTLSDIFTCWAPLGNKTAFEGIVQIPPGCFGVLNRNCLKIQSYWQPSFFASDPWERSLTDWTEELTSLLYDATRIRLRADVPVGTYLSGGLDSSYTTSIVKNNFNNRLCSFSVTFSDQRFDETPYQQKAVENLNTHHRSILCTEKNIGEAFPEVIWHSEVPILRTAPAPLYRLSALVREHNFKVVLTGEGSDEIFAGYNIFKEDKVRRFWARKPDSTLRPRLLERLYPYIFSQNNGRSKTYIENFFRKNLNNIDSPIYSHMVRWQNTAQLKSFLSDDIQQTAGRVNDFVERYLQCLPPEFASWPSLCRAQYTEMGIFLSNYLLSSQGDRMTMAHSVEGRYPFLDHRVIEFAARLPVRFKLNGLEEKFILKRAARNAIPREIADRPKQPYRAPISRCFLGAKRLDYVEQLLSARALEKSGYFDTRKVSCLVAKCRRLDGRLLSERENMALVGILSTQLVDHHFIRNFPSYPVHAPKNVKIEG